MDGERLHGSRPIAGNETIRLGEILVEVLATDPRQAAAGEDDAERVADALGVPAEEVRQVEPGLAAPAGRRAYSLRAAVAAIGRARHAARVAIAVAAVALAIAGVAVALALTGVLDDGSDAGRTDEIARSARPSTVRVSASSEGDRRGGSGWVLDAATGS